MSNRPSEVIEIGQSPWKLLALLAGATVFVLACLAIPLGWIGDRAPDPFVDVVCWIAVTFFGACGIVALRRLLGGAGPVVTLSPTGFRDTRVAAETIPWTAVGRICTWSFQGQRIMVLEVAREVESTLSLTAYARLSRGPNRVLGADGLCISTNDLGIDYDSLVAHCMAFLEASRASEASRPGRGQDDA